MDRWENYFRNRVGFYWYYINSKPSYKLINSRALVLSCNTLSSYKWYLIVKYQWNHKYEIP